METFATVYAHARKRAIIVIASRKVSGATRRWLIMDERGVFETQVAEGQHVTFKHGCGSVWDGRPKYESWYA